MLQDYLFNNYLGAELSRRNESGTLFPLLHIKRSIRLAGQLNMKDLLILDIGGGIGATIRLFRQAFPETRIMVFEPVKENYNSIVKKSGNDSRTEIFNLAAGNENTSCEINIANRITSSSLLPLAAESQSTYYDSSTLGKSRSQTIEIVRLDDFLRDRKEEIGIMKLDVQGFELAVLEGAVETLERTALIVLETGNHDVYLGAPRYYEIDNFLRNKGFSLYDIVPSVLDKGRLKEWDVIYLSKRISCTLE